MTSLKHKTISGIKWTLIASVAQRALSFVATIILARILTPADYGLFALAFVMIDGFGIFKSLGFDSALVRRKDGDIEKAANTAFFLIPAMGMILFGILYIVAPWGSGALGNPQVTPIIRTLGLVFVISCFGKVPQTILYRSMQFKYKSYGEIAAQAVYVITAITLALNKFGVWSLVIAYVCKTFTQMIMDWSFSGWRPQLWRIERERQDTMTPSHKSPGVLVSWCPGAQSIKLNFDTHLAKEMFQFGKFVLGSGIIGFLFSNLDNLIIGKFLGVTMLGYYALAMSLANSLNGYFLGKVGMIMYPAYSKIQEQTRDVERVMLKMLKYVGMIALPFCVGLLIFATDILRVVFGEKWLPATNVLRILALVGLLRAIGSSIWPVFLAKGQPKIDFLMNALQVAFFTVLVIPLAMKFGLNGAATALLIATLVSFCLGIIRIKSILGVKLVKMLEAIKLHLLSSLFMVGAAYFLKATVITSNLKLNFLLAAGVSGGAYLLVTYHNNRKILREIREAF
ncbi:MAG: lipopolysaccharide biosynthesis protein [Patescibacteria group bacterium]